MNLTNDIPEDNLPDLVRAAAGGDERSLELLLVKLRPMTLRIVSDRLADAYGQRQDAVAECMEAYVRALSSIVVLSAGEARGFFATVARRTVIDFTRRRTGLRGKKFQLYREVRDHVADELAGGPAFHVAEFAQANGLDYEEVYDLYVTARRQTACSVNRVTENEMSLFVFDPSTDAPAEHEALSRALTTLPDATALLLEKRFGLNGREPMNSVELGREMGVSSQYVTQLTAKALGRLRRRLGSRSKAAIPA